MAVCAAAPGAALAWDSCGCGGWGYGHAHYRFHHYGYGYGSGYGSGYGYGYGYRYRRSGWSGWSGDDAYGYGYPTAFASGAYARTTTRCTASGCAAYRCDGDGDRCEQVGPWYWRH